MAAPRERLTRLTVPFRALAQRFTFVALVGGAFALMLLGKADTALTERVRLLAGDAVVPILALLSEPVATVNRGVRTVDSFLNVYTDNARLREENERLRQWQTVARRVEQENAAYRTLLNAKSESRVSYITARVVGDTSGPFVRTMIVAAGTADGVAKGFPVVTGDGVVGHIVESGERASRVLLMTDLNSRLPVLIESSRVRAILAGDNTDRPRLQFFANAGELQRGDRIITSGHGGVFPPGLPVGIVASVGDRAARVQPYVDLERLEYVRVLRLDLPRLSENQDDGRAAARKP